jgi:hypothetical protein
MNRTKSENGGRDPLTHKRKEAAGTSARIGKTKAVLRHTARGGCFLKRDLEGGDAIRPAGGGAIRSG